MHHRKTNCPCDQCGKTFEESHTLPHHNSSYHETNVYPCNQYEKTSNESGTLKQHIRSCQEKDKYPCNKREITFIELNTPKQCKSSCHEKEQYKCVQCDFKTTTNFSCHYWIKINILCLKLTFYCCLGVALIAGMGTLFLMYPTCFLR